MDDLRRELDAVLARVAALEAVAVERDATIAELNSTIARLSSTIAERDAVIVERDARIAELEAQVAELTVEIQRRKKGFRPKSNAISRPKKDKDGRKVGERKHPGVQRDEVPAGPGPPHLICQ